MLPFQTGSGKTYTMGTQHSSIEQDKGIIPRAATHLFSEIVKRKAEARSSNEAEPKFDVLVQFIEVRQHFLELNQQSLFSSTTRRSSTCSPSTAAED
jgi:hypothetical protein